MLTSATCPFNAPGWVNSGDYCVGDFLNSLVGFVYKQVDAPADPYEQWRIQDMAGMARARDGFRERGALGHLSFGGPKHM